jgi:hypothetical protein
MRIQRQLRRQKRYPLEKATASCSREATRCH